MLLLIFLVSASAANLPDCPSLSCLSVFAGGSNSAPAGVEVALSTMLIPNLFSPPFNGMAATAVVCNLTLYGAYKSCSDYSTPCYSVAPPVKTLGLAFEPLCSPEFAQIAAGMGRCFGQHLRTREVQPGYNLVTKSRAWSACESAFSASSSRGVCGAGPRLTTLFSCLRRLSSNCDSSFRRITDLQDRAKVRWRC